MTPGAPPSGRRGRRPGSRSDTVTERRWRILEMLRDEGRVDANLVRLKDPALNYSDATLLGDFDASAALGVAVRVGGGLLPIRPDAATYFGRMHSDPCAQQEREVIAHYVAENLIRPHETIMVGNGNTVLAAAAESLSRHTGLVLITSNCALPQYVRHESVLMLPGYFERDIFAVTGPRTEAMIKQWYEERRPQRTILGTSGVTTDGKLFCHRPVEIHALEEMCRLARHLIVVAGGSKIGTTEIEWFFKLRTGHGPSGEYSARRPPPPPHHHTTLVTTETPTNQSALRELRKSLHGSGVELVVAPPVTPAAKPPAAEEPT